MSPLRRSAAMRRAGRAAAGLSVLALACALPRPYEPPGGAGATTAPIRDSYARARIEMVRAVNEDRARHGVGAVVLDSLATVVAQSHAEEMAAGGWLSHYNAAGLAPYERLAAAGGTGHVLENVFRSQERSGNRWPAEVLWDRFDIREAERWLMSSEGHRATILDPHHTRIGVGIALDPSRGAVYVVQEFVTATATIEPPGRVLPGQEAGLSGRMRADGARPLMLVLTREPLVRDWVARGDRPPGGAYSDGGSDRMVIPPWAIRWNPDDRSFGVRIRIGRGIDEARWYGVLYAAPEAAVRRALSDRAADTGMGWPAAAFVVEVL